MDTSDVDKNDYIAKKLLMYLPEPDFGAASTKCLLLKQGVNDIADLDAIEFEEFVKLAVFFNPSQLHALTVEHPQHDQSKIMAQHALKSDQGIKTCIGVAKKCQRFCGSCEWGLKVKTPYFLKFLDGFIEIPTQEYGFYNTMLNKKGEYVKGKPNYDDLLSFFKTKLPFVTMADSGLVFTWNNKYWEPLNEPEIKGFAEKHFSPKPSRNMRNEFFSKVRANELYQPDWFNESVHGKINLQNGVFDITSGTLEEHSKDLGFRYCLPYSYDENAECPRFEQFLDEITKSRDELKQILMQYMGYCLSGDEYWNHKALFLYGEGANGKSTLLNTLMELVGKNNYAAQSLGELNDPQNRYELDGKLFNVSEEAGVDSIHQSEIFKRMVGGNEITIKKLYSQPYTIRNHCKLIISCNELPKSGDKTLGMYRRMLIVPFDATFSGTKRDTSIQRKLDKELPGIFNLAIRWYRVLKEQGDFTTSEDVQEQLREYEEENDNTIYWRNERVDTEDVTDKAFVTNEDLYKDYKQFTQENMQRPLSRIQFFKRFNKIVPLADKTSQRVDYKVVRGYKNVLLRRD